MKNKLFRLIYSKLLYNNIIKLCELLKTTCTINQHIIIIKLLNQPSLDNSRPVTLKHPWTCIIIIKSTVITISGILLSQISLFGWSGESYKIIALIAMLLLFGLTISKLRPRLHEYVLHGNESKCWIVYTFPFSNSKRILFSLL